MLTVVSGLKWNLSRGAALSCCSSSFWPRRLHSFSHFSLYWLCWSILDILNGCIELSKRSFPAFGKLRFYFDGLMFDTTDFIDSLMFAFEAILSIIYFLVWRYWLQELFLYLIWIIASLYSRLLLYFLMAGLEKSRSQDAFIGSYMFKWLLKCCILRNFFDIQKLVESRRKKNLTDFPKNMKKSKKSKFLPKNF